MVSGSRLSDPKRVPPNGDLYRNIPESEMDTLLTSHLLTLRQDGDTGRNSSTSASSFSHTETSKKIRGSQPDPNLKRLNRVSDPLYYLNPRSFSPTTYVYPQPAQGRESEDPFVHPVRPLHTTIESWPQDRSTGSFQTTY